MPNHRAVSCDWPVSNRREIPTRVPKPAAHHDHQSKRDGRNPHAKEVNTETRKRAVGQSAPPDQGEDDYYRLDD